MGWKADFIEAMVVRRRNLSLRLAIGASVGAVFTPILGWTLVLPWLVVWVALQLLEMSCTRRIESARDITRVRAPPVLCLVFVTNLVFMTIGLAAMLRGEDLMMSCGVLLMAGALLNAGATSGVSSAVFIASSAPAAIIGLALVLITLSSGEPAPVIFALAGALALMMFAVYAMRDVSVKALRTAKAASDSKGEFLANLSHEIRTPLNGVLGMAQAMEAGELPQDQRQRLDVINRSGRALLTLLNDVLDLAKVEAGKLEIELREVDVAEVSRDLARTFDVSSRQKGVPVEIEVDGDVEGPWLGDPTRIRQILTNLISNAVKFTSEGQVAISLRREAEGVSVLVADSGIGIPADRLAQVFDKYAQASSSTSRQFGGTGLGLAICRDLAVLMNGEITVESRLGGGSVFRLWLPLQRWAGPRAEAGAMRAVEMDFARLRVLAAEDHETNQMVLQLLLAQVGIEVHIVPNGRAAVEAWKNETWDLILMDVQMPELDGPAATREIRLEERRTGRRPTPILALTANAMRHQIEAYLACGMDGHVAKPLEFLRLIEAVAAAVEPTGELVSA